jgi:polar amino acid transport system permease protein
MFQYTWDWGIIWQFRFALFKGILVTLELTILSLIFGTIIGLILGVLIDKKIPFISRVLIFITDIIRSLPLLIFLLLLNYWLPYTIGRIPSFWVAVLALTLNLSAFISDLIRGAIKGVSKSSKEAGKALGMNQNVLMKKVILPEAIRDSIPPISLMYIHILKISSLASVITVNELLHVADAISVFTFRYLEIFTFLAFIYVIIILPLANFQRKLEQSKWLVRRS